MNKLILFIVIIIGFCFTQTGMLADKKDGAFGIWVEVIGMTDAPKTTNNAPAIYDNASAMLSLDYMFGFGLELGIDYGSGKETTFEPTTLAKEESEYQIQGYSAAYHFKSYKGSNFYLGYKEMEKFEIVDDEPDEDPFSELSTISLGFYSNKRAFFELSQETEKDIQTKEEDIVNFLEFGGIVRFRKGGKGGLLISYKLNADDVEQAFDEEDFEYLKYGELTLSIGGAF